MSDFIGVLQYSDDRKSLRRLLVRSELGLYLSKIAIRHQGELLEDGMGLVKGVALEGMSLRKDKSALFSEFSVVLMLSYTQSGDEFEVEIPIENDELQISKAKVPGKIILEVAK